MANHRVNPEQVATLLRNLAGPVEVRERLVARATPHPDHTADLQRSRQAPLVAEPFGQVDRTPAMTLARTEIASDRMKNADRRLGIGLLLLQAHSFGFLAVCRDPIDGLAERGSDQMNPKKQAVTRRPNEGGTRSFRLNQRPAGIFVTPILVLAEHVNPGQCKQRGGTLTRILNAVQVGLQISKNRPGGIEIPLDLRDHAHSEARRRL